MTNMTTVLTEFFKENWSQILLLGGGVIAYFTGREGRVDKHKYDKSLTFNIDIDSLSDSFDLSQKMLTAVRQQLDDTQSLLDDANRAYAIVKKELNKAIEEIRSYKAKTESLGKENKELMKRLNTCEFECANKNI